MTRRQSRIGIFGATVVDAVVQVRRRAACVAGVADVAKHVAGVHDVALAEAAEAIEMGVVMPLESRAKDADNLAAEPI